MRAPHILVTVVLLVAAYLVGVKYPQYGQMALSKIGV